MKNLKNNFTLGSFLLITCLALAGCGNTSKDQEKIALVIDLPSINDNSYHQGTWEALKAYLAEKGYDEENVTYFKPDSEVIDPDALIQEAIDWGAKGIIANGHSFETTIYDKQTAYPEVKFLLQDTAPCKNGDVKITSNTLATVYKEHESGYLAGYCAALEGYSNFGFIGGINYEPVQRYGIGFAGGVYQALSETKREGGCNYFAYADTFLASEATTAMASEWYNEGVEVIFGAAGIGNESICDAAETTNKQVIGVDSDQHGLSPTILTSALKCFDAGLKQFLDQFFNGWIGGTANLLGVKEKGVALPTNSEAWRFKNVSVKDYEDLAKKIINGNLIVPETYEDLQAQVTSLGYTLNLTKDQVIGNK